MATGFAEPEKLQSLQRDGDMHSLWSDVELLAKGRYHGETPRDCTLSVNVGRGHPPTSRVQDGTDEDCVRGSPEDRESRGQTRTLVSDRRTGRRVHACTWSTIKKTSQRRIMRKRHLRHRRKQLATTSETTSSTVRKHRNGRDESSTQWSRCDAQRRVNGIHGDDIVEVCEHELTETNRFTKCVT